MLSDLLKWGGRRSGRAGTGDVSADEGVVVPSKALPKFLSALSQHDAPVLLDFGAVLGGNVAFFGERLGCKLFIEDLVGDIERHVKAGTMGTLPEIFPTRFRHEDASVDGILCWEVFDFLPRAGAEALARQVVRMLKPGGAAMGFFSTATAERAAFTRFEVASDTTLRHRTHHGPGAAKHVLQNRDIIRMFDGLVVSDSFLLKTNTREILLRRR